jgi:hypothetical protein
MTIVKKEKRGRKKDAIRKYFISEEKVSTCNYCNKKFSSATTLALKGHLAGDRFNKLYKTTACPNVPMHIKNYYINHMNNRKRSKSRKKELLENLDAHDDSDNSNNDTESIIDSKSDNQHKCLDENNDNSDKCDPTNNQDIFANPLSQHSAAYQLASRYFFGPKSSSISSDIISNNNNCMIDHSSDSINESELKDLDDLDANSITVIQNLDDENYYEFEIDMFSDMSRLPL